jgi:2-octaprenyl-6-methoxyphenol hydroxylase
METEGLAMTDCYDLAIVGGGLAGATAALALARDGRKVALVARPPDHADHRTTALLMPAIDLLDDIGIWPVVADEAAALSTMRIIDGSNRLVRAPAVSFNASEIGETAFGYNIPNGALLKALDAAIDDADGITRYGSAAQSVSLDGPVPTVRLADGGSLSARIIVAADGRRSVMRSAAGISTKDWSYPQTALVTVFAHERPHGDISTELHTEEGPFTQVPLPGDRSSLVWVMSPDAARRMAVMEPAALSEAIEARMQSMLGRITVDGPVQTFALSGMTAERFAAGPVVLVGEAGHVFPPIGAQGLNLGMRDVMALRMIVREETSSLGLDDAAAQKITRRYADSRRADVRMRSTGVDLLNRSLLSNFLPVHLGRAAGLSLLAAAAPLRTMTMREGMTPGGALRSFGQGLARTLRGSGEKIRRVARRS